MADINVVVGPPCAGKSVYVQSNRSDGDVVVDYDLIAQALGAKVRHQAEGSIRILAFRLRRSAISAIVDGIRHDAWIIHTNPSKASVSMYLESGAKFHLINPGIEECRSRAKTDQRPESTLEAIDAWYANPPSLELDQPTKGVVWLERNRLKTKAK